MPRFRGIPKPIPEDLFDRKKHELVIKEFLDAGAEDIRVDFRTTTRTWKGKPDFVIEQDESLGKFGRKIYTSNRIYFFVSGGTRIRYATMTRGFVPKTHPYVIGSGAGRGGVRYISKKHPRPGIRARMFPRAIRRKWESRWVELYLRMLHAAASH